MTNRPTYEELEQRAEALEETELEYKRTVDALRESEEKYRTLFDLALDGFVMADAETGEILECNNEIARMVGRDKSELIGNYQKILHPEQDTKGKVSITFKQHLGNDGATIETQLITEKGELKPVEIKANAFEYQGVKVLQGLFRDITKRKQTDMILRFSNRMLDIMTGHHHIGPLLRESVSELKHFTCCAAAGIRLLDEDGNIPYQTYDGFSRAFYESESPLSIKSDRCMCINVIKGMSDSKSPFYTEGGSFYMNGARGFLASVSQEGKRETRDACNEAGYESVALVPIRQNGEISGLLHVADPKENMVPLHVVKSLEGLGRQLGSAILRIRSREALRDREQELRRISKHLEEVNVALNVILEKRHADKLMIEEKVLFNVKELVEPFIGRLKNSGLDENQAGYVDALATSLAGIVSPFSQTLHSRFIDLTLSEIRVANLIREGRTTKEIAPLLDSTPRAVEFHRQNIRKKLGLSNRKANLASHLLSLPQ